MKLLETSEKKQTAINIRRYIKHLKDRPAEIQPHPTPLYTGPNSIDLKKTY